MRRELPWLCKVESKRLLWLLGVTFALIVTFQYIELPNAISSFFSSSKLPISRNSTSHLANLTPAMAPSFPQLNSTLGNDSVGNEEEEEEEEEVDSTGNATAPSISSTTTTFSPSLPILKENATAPVASAEAPATLPGLKPKGIATAPVATAKAPAALPGLNPENATMSTKEIVVRFVPDLEENARVTDSRAISISEMSKQLRQNRISHSHSAKKPKWVTRPDLELLQAKYEIENAPISDKDPLLYSPLYRNVSIFKRSYELMEKMLKVYIYKEGDKRIMHNPILKGIYGSEGWFMKLIESNTQFVTKDPAKAHLFYLPFSSRMLEITGSALLIR